MTRILIPPLLALACAAPETAAPVQARIEVEEGRRETAYTLIYPEGVRGPRPAVVMLHGFSRSRRRLENHARALAERGFLVLVPDGLSLLLPGGRQRNVEDILTALDWLVRRSATEGDALFGAVDATRLGLAGHSAGGALAVMAAAAARDQGRPVRALLLLDAVPWPETLDAAKRLGPPLAVASLRSEPSASNARGAVARLVEAFPFPITDAKVKGASHIDAEYPTDALARTFAGPLHPECQEIYHRLLLAFFEQQLGAAADRPFDRELAAQVGAGKVLVPPEPPDPARK
ncbi:MAG: alpha/beta fold hydrolase [Planctomycetes bacterium]|nr:alpha/beta fold hydrolase [Planctomycetota bacterium]